MAANTIYKCPTCGAEIFWNAKEGCFKCEYCDSKFSMEEMDQTGQGQIDETKIERHEEVDREEYAQTTDGTISNDFVKYTCTHCGAEIITDRATAATICVYCGNAVIMSEQIIDDFKPDYVIPFKISKDSVMDSFKKFSKKPLTPKDFDCERIVDKMQGVYIPFWLYSGSCHGKIQTEAYTEKKWRSGNTEYTEKEYYSVMRDGNVTFKNVPVDASSKTDNDAMDSIEPFDYSELKPFNAGYLSGFIAERFDEDKKTCLERATLRFENSTLEELMGSCRSQRDYYFVEKPSMYQKQAEISEVKYALMPTWLLYTTYNGQQYLFAMNGQTGKFIGNLPISKGKLAAYCALTFFITSLILTLISYVGSSINSCADIMNYIMTIMGMWLL